MRGVCSILTVVLISVGSQTLMNVSETCRGFNIKIASEADRRLTDVCAEVSRIQHTIPVAQL